MIGAALALVYVQFNAPISNTRSPTLAAMQASQRRATSNPTLALQTQPGAGSLASQREARAPSRSTNPPLTSPSQNMLTILAKPSQQSFGRAPENFPLASQSAEITLPTVFQGCWQSMTHRVNEDVGSIRTTGPFAWVGCIDPPGNSEFCYKRVGNGPFEPTFSSSRINSRWAAQAGKKISHETSRVEILSTDGTHEARLRTHGHHDELELWVILASIDDTNDLTCRIDGNHMHCLGQSHATLNGYPWCISTGRTNFTRVPE